MDYSKPKKPGYFHRTAVKDWNTLDAFEEYKTRYSLPLTELLKTMKGDLASGVTKFGKAAVERMTKDLQHLTDILVQQNQQQPTTSTSTTGKLADSINNIQKATQINYTTCLENRRQDIDKNNEYMGQDKADKRKSTGDYQETGTADQCRNQDAILLKKLKKSYSFHPPNPTPSISTNKPRINDADASRLKPLYYIKISDTKGTPSLEPAEAEYKQNMNDQAINKCLQQLPHALEFLKQALNQPLDNLLKFISSYNLDDTAAGDELQTLQLMKYILTDYHANCLKPAHITSTNERTPFCDHVLPIFKYFSAVTGLLSFIWCEKASTSIKQLLVYQPESGNRLFDGIGTSVKDKVERMLIECSGDMDGDHTEEDSLKLLDCTSKCLQLEMMNYRSASISTFKKRRIIGIQSIGNKITMTSTGLGEGGYYYIEQRSSIVPRDWGKSHVLDQGHGIAFEAQGTIAGTRSRD